MTHLIQLTRELGIQKIAYLPGIRSRRTWTFVARKRGKDDSKVAPFRTTRLTACTHLLSNVMQSKRFLSHLILTLSWCLKNKIRSRWEKFASLYNPFFRISQIAILATAMIVRNTTCFSPRYGGWILFGINAGRPLPDVTPKRANPLAVVEGVQNRSFLATAAADAIRHVYQARLKGLVSQGQRILGKPLGERELGVVQEARTWRSIPLRANLLQRPAELLHERTRSETHH